MSSHQNGDYEGGPVVMVGDCLDRLAELGDASVDAIVTDPPYGLEFMGKDWDAPWQSGVGLGGHSAGLSSTGYTDGANRMQRPSYTGTTNPTCRNCGGLRSGREGKKGQQPCRCDAPRFDNIALPRMVAFQAWCEQWATECLRVLKPGGHMLAFGGSRTAHRLASAVEDAGFEIRDSIVWIYASGFPKSHNLKGEHEGWGTALKPAHEPIVVARKPLAGTVAANVQAHGTGALNIDGCRVNPGAMVAGGGGWAAHKVEATEGWDRPYKAGASKTEGHSAGRWPSNIVLSHSLFCDDDACYEGCPVLEVDQQSGITKTGATPLRRSTALGVMNDDAWQPQDTTGTRYPGVGGASRFFPVFRYQPKAPTRERPKVDGIAHPTVKPLDLMRWLIRLVTPPGGTVLEPFAGSGTTVEAALLEGFHCIAIEREETYVSLIQQRIDRVMGGAA